MDAQRELLQRGFVHAGTIRPVDSGRRCKANITTSLQGRVTYALLVGDQLKKCGDTGRKNATLKKRMTDCERAINLVLSGALVGPFSENFKPRASKAIEEHQQIDVWAREASADECRNLQRELNGKYDTIGSGWANRLQ